MSTLIEVSRKMAAELKLTSNGEGAKTAKVTVVARSGDAIDNPYWGYFVHDFAGMTVKPKIPLDYEHDPDDSIGYLNKFDVSSGDLVCSGVLVLGATDSEDEVATLVNKMQAGIPYEASIEFGEDMTLEYVPEGMSVLVNGRDIVGPVTVIRQWTLKAVAICKFGCDSDTSVELQLSKKSKPNKGYFIKLSKGTNMDDKTEKDKEADAVDTEAADEVAPVEAVDAEKEKESPSAEDAPAPVEADKPAEADEEDKDKELEVNVTVATSLSHSKEAVEAVDPRTEFKLFVSTFGAEKAADYFARGLTLTAAQGDYVKHLKADNEALRAKLNTVDRGASQAVTFSANGDSRDAVNSPKGMAAVIKINKQR